MAELSSGYVIKSCSLTWEREKIVMYEQIVTVRLHTHKKRWLPLTFVIGEKHFLKICMIILFPLKDVAKPFCQIMLLKESRQGRTWTLFWPNGYCSARLSQWASAQRACLLREGCSLYPPVSHVRGNHSIRGASSWFCIVIQATRLDVVLCQSCTKSQNRVLISRAAHYGDS